MPQKSDKGTAPPKKAASDRKEHHFCFTYRGERLRVTPFEALHFAHVQGTSTSDGMQLVRVTLKRPNGRRANTVAKIIQEYNFISKTEPVVAVPFDKKDNKDTAVYCFKTNSANGGHPIVMQINADREAGSVRFWSWSCSTETKVQPKPTKAKKTKQASFAGLEELVRCSLNLDPSKLNMHGAYDRVLILDFSLNNAYVSLSFQPQKNETNNTRPCVTTDRPELLPDPRDPLQQLRADPSQGSRLCGERVAALL